MVARRKKKRQQTNYLQEALLLAVGATLMVCAMSVGYGFFARRADAVPVLPGVRIEILNGTGVSNLAKETARALMIGGVDVLKVGNADRFDYKESVLIARTRRGNIEDLATRLHCRNVIEQLKSGSLVDATLIIGADYRRLNLGPKSGLNN
ncbi:MAG: LytR C-terminal domain-containing protein [bacterium]|nr:LytR C-terminal domain-containing protein [bacterium]